MVEGVGSGHRIKKRGPNICSSYKPVKGNVKAAILPLNTISPSSNVTDAWTKLSLCSDNIIHDGKRARDQVNYL